jgi:hypothetical protein
MAVSYSEQAGTAFGTPVVTSRLAIHPWQEGDEKSVADFLNADAGIFPSRNHHYAYNMIGPFDEDRVRKEVFPAMREIYESRPLFELYIRDRTDSLGSRNDESEECDTRRQHISNKFEHLH